MSSRKRAWSTALAILLVGGILGAMCPIGWLGLLIRAPFLWVYLWLVYDYRHSDFAWWVVKHPKESPRLLLSLATFNVIKIRLRWKIWKSRHQKKKQAKKS